MSDEETVTMAPATRRGRPRKTAGPERTGLTPEATAMLQGFEAMVTELREARKEQPLAQAQAFAKIQNPSNIIAPGRSVFNPRGEKDYPLPPLKCEIHAPWRIHPAYHGLDREEVELFNLLEPGEYRIELVDGSMAKLAVRVIKNDVTGAIEKMHLDANWTEEHKGKFPAMRQILRQILGETADGVLTMKQEQAAINRGELAVSI